MVLISRFSLMRKTIFAQVFGDKGVAYFWGSHFLPGWLPVLLGIVLGIGSAVLITTNGLWQFLFPLALAVPAAVLFIRYPFVAVMLWILMFPYFVHPISTADRFIYWILHRAMIPAALGIVILSDWFGIRNRDPVRFGRAELAMLLFLGLALANIFLLTPEQNRSLITLYDRLFIPFCMYWLVRLVAPTRKDLKRLMWIGFITVIAQSIIGLLAWFAPQVLLPQWLSREGRTVGTLGNPAVYTSTLIFLSLFLFQYGMQSKSRWLRAVFLLTFSLAFFCVFLSFSRGSWLGGLLVWMGLMLVYPKVMLRWTVVALIVGLVLGGTLLVSEISWASTRLNDEDTAEGRILGGAKSVQMIAEKPWTGWGYGTYDFYDEQFRTRVGNLATSQDKTSHNTYLTLMAEMGVLAFLIYLFPMLWWLVLSRKAWRRLPRSGFLSWHLLAMLWLLMLDHFAVSNFMDMIRFNLFGTTIWWMALGLIAGLVYPYLEPSDIGAPRWAYQSVRAVQSDHR